MPEQFDADGQACIRTLFAGRTLDVTYHNPARQDTFAAGMTIQRSVLHLPGGDMDTEGPNIPAPYAAMVRAGQIPLLDMYFT